MAIKHSMLLIQSHENSIKTAEYKEQRNVPNVGMVKCKDKKLLSKTIKPNYNLRSSQKERKNIPNVNKKKSLMLGFSHIGMTFLIPFQ